MNCVLALILTIATTAPTTAPSSASSFHGGGALLGQASELPPPPMKLRWTYQCDDGGDADIEGAAAIDSSTVYIADARGVLHAIDLASGKRRWTYHGGEEGFATTPLLIKGNVLIGDLGGTVHAVAIDTGHKRWTLDTGAPIHASANAATVDSDRVVTSNDAGKIVCLDPTDGAVHWTAQAGDRINSAAAIVDDTVYISGCDSRLTVLNLADGKPRYEPVDIGAVSAGSPAVVEDRIVLGTDSGRVLCLKRDDGELIWTYEQIKEQAMVYASPAVADGIVVVGARDRHVHAINLSDGKPLWTFKTRLDVDSSPIISAGRVYVGSKDKSLFVLDLKSGKMLWEFKASRGIIATPASANGALVIGDNAGNVYCLQPAGK